MHHPLLVLLVPLALLLPSTFAWGTLGHRTVAYLASLYFTPESTRFTNQLLHGQDISEAALFPDKIRYIPSFAYTKAWHYIDAQDDPPTRCGINITRDCALETGCVVSAIANHTERVGDAGLPMWQRGQSLRFVLHFFGDVHQPLHTEAEDRGGNEYAVVFDGRATNLHSVWDSLIVNRHAGMGHEDETLAAWTWAQRLAAGRDAEDDEDVCLRDAAECALEWAGEANAYVCSYVLARDVHGQDLAGEYYDGAVPIIDDMVYKAGRRLAAWINAIVGDMDYADLDLLDPEPLLRTQIN
ncbi:Nuclease S1 [Cladophialophora carrionii]|uniref:Nuclease S1 n=1 Tax=Cladophialophora carrionii TaxID=86049 RepID=A0A1C1CS61_9EURO|nr:Nuclease S1 [Cladophialophora carrionii]